MTYLEGDQACDILLLVPNDHHIAEEGHLLLDGVLYGDRGHVLSSRCDDDLCGWDKRMTMKHLFTAGDVTSNATNYY